MQRQVGPIRAREHIHHLQAYGLSHKAIAQLCGVSITLIQSVLAPPGNRNYRRFIYASSERLILRGRFDLDRLPAEALVDVAGTRRRVQALACVGWSQVAIADMLGVDHTVVSRYATGAARVVQVYRAREVRDIYDKHSMTLGSNPQAAGHAKAHHWAPPWAWDDETMDDPSVEPDLSCLQPRKGPKPSEDTLEDVAWLLEEVMPFATVQQVAARLGVTKDAITRAFKRVEQYACEAAYGDTLGPLPEDEQYALEDSLALLRLTRDRLAENKRLADQSWRTAGQEEAS